MNDSDVEKKRMLDRRKAELKERLKECLIQGISVDEMADKVIEICEDNPDYFGIFYRHIHHSVKGGDRV